MEVCACRVRFLSCYPSSSRWSTSGLGTDVGCKPGTHRDRRRGVYSLEAHNVGCVARTRWSLTGVTLIHTGSHGTGVVCASRRTRIKVIFLLPFVYPSVTLLNPSKRHVLLSRNKEFPFRKSLLEVISSFWTVLGMRWIIIIAFHRVSGKRNMCELKLYINKNNAKIHHINLVSISY